MKIPFALLALAALATGCASDANDSMRTDKHGNYASTSQYQAMDRATFSASMQAGLRDFDLRLASLKTQAEALGPDAVEEYHSFLDSLMEARREFAATMQRHDALLASDWDDQREDVAEMYGELRDDLDQAFEEVLEEA